jgi:hypothetical protein
MSWDLDFLLFAALVAALGWFAFLSALVRLAAVV